MAKLKVFGGSLIIKGKQVSACVATTSQAKAAKIANVSINEIRDYWSITNNKNAVECAMSKPETLFVSDSTVSYNYKPAN